MELLKHWLNPFADYLLDGHLFLREKFFLNGAVLFSLLCLAVLLLILTLWRSHQLSKLNRTLRSEVAERKKTQQAFLEQSERLRSILDAIGDGILVADQAGMIILMNPAARRILERDVVGLDIATDHSAVELYLADSTTPYPADRHPLLRSLGGESIDSEQILLRSNRSPQDKWMSVTARPIKDPSGIVRGAVAVFRDITKSKAAEVALSKTERELRETQDVFHNFMDNSPTLAFLKDEQGRYVYINQTFARQENVTLADIRGKTDFDWLPNHVAQHLSDKDQAVLDLKDGKVIESVEQMPSADGAMHEWLAFKFLIRTASHKKYIGGIFVDISERKKAEEAIRRANAELELRVLERTRELDKAIEDMQAEIMGRKRAEKDLAARADELAASNSELEQFAMVASHDLQEPLRKISSYGGLLQERYKDRLDESGEKFISYMVDGAQRMQILVRDLLTYARFGKKEVTFEPVDVGRVLAEVLADLESMIQEAEAAVTSDDLPTVHGNTAQVRQLFQNLLSNALKFRSVSSPRIHISAVQEEDKWLIGVRDNGIGIDPKNADRIFQVFQRLHPRSQYPGSGIGLAVCKKIVERHGGRIWVKSAKDQGATFYFTLPVQAETQRAETSTETVSSSVPQT